MLPQIEFGQIEFGEPDYLWFLVIPAILLVLWIWRFMRRRADNRALAARRTVPIRERFALVGDLPFWLCLILASASLIIALAHPHGPAQIVRQGLDLVTSKTDRPRCASRTPGTATSAPCSFCGCSEMRQLEK